MPLNWNQLRTITTRELSSALRRDGFMLKRQTGSHQIYRHPDGRRVTLSYHRPGATQAADTLRSIILNQARWTEQDLQRWACTVAVLKHRAGQCVLLSHNLVTVSIERARELRYN